MPILNFQKVFAPKVESGIKRQTIRRKRADGRDPKTGDTLYLYTGLRTKSCRKIGQHTCTSSVPVLIDERDIVVAGQLLDRDTEEHLAEADGFVCVSNFRHFFIGDSGDQFEGVLIKW